MASKLRNFDLVLSETFTIGFPLTFVHATLGAIAEILGEIFISRKFGNIRMMMRLTMVTWIATSAFETVFYVYYYFL